MATTVPVGDGIPSAFYRNAIDLNRFSNSVSKKLVNSYNNVILKAVEQLEKIEKQPLSKQPAYKTARLRALIKQTKESLNTWAGGSVDELIAELEGVAKVQAGFIEEQLKKSMPRGMTEKISDQLGYAVNSVSISPSFAKAVVNTDPTALNLAVLRSDLAGAKAPKGTFKLTAKEGQTITLPNGNTVRKSFLGIAEAEAKRLNQVVRTGLLGGQTTDEIVRDLVGTLQKDQKGSLSKLLAQGGAATKSANGQVMTIVRTTVNQVTNTASQAVYKANPDVTEEYRYVATLDSRTSPVCRDLDGQIFKYNEGPVPPQHFGCRSTTVAVINYKKWGFTPPPAGKRASVDGPVPANTTYGKWLYDQRKPNTKFKAGSEQIAALGRSKAQYFNRLANKYGPDQALKKLIREDNTEVSLTQLQKRYGKPENIKKTTKAKSKQSIAEKLKKGQQKMKTNIEKLDKEMAVIDKQIKESKAKLKALETSSDKDDLLDLYKSQKAATKDSVKKWNDKSFIQKNIASTDDKTPPPPRKAVKNGKKTTKDLLYEPDYEDTTKDYDLTSAEFSKTLKQVSNWTGNSYRDIRGVQIKQAKLAGKQLNPNEAKQLRLFEDRYKGEMGIINRTARNAERLENYVAKSPKWAGEAADVRFGDVYYDKQPDGTIFRGMTVNKKSIVEAVIQNLQKGEAVTTMESWSTDPRTAMKFAKGEIGSGNHGIMLKHVNKYGTPIENLNGMAESEILQPSGVRYKVINVRKKEWTETVKWKGGEDLQEHSMTEIVLQAI